MVSRFVTSGPVKQDGICLFSPPPHYRMMASQRSDGFSVSTPAGSYVPQTQGPNQGPGIRGIPSAGPPNQSSTPPNADLKVQNLPGQITPMQFVQPVRTAQPQYFQSRGAAGPPSQTPRMPNQQHRPQGPPQTLYPSQYVVPQAVYLQPNAMFYNPTQRPPGGIMTAQTYSPQVYQQQLAYQPFSQQASSGVPAYAPVYYNPQQSAAMMSRTPVVPATAAPPNTAPGNMQAAPLIPQPGQTHSNYQRTNQKQRRPKAISIIDPNTGEDKLNEIFDENNSHPASGESSARQTPQPAPPNPNKEVQAAFAKQVAQAINEDFQNNVSNEQPPPLHEPSPPEHFQLSPQPTQPISTAHILQSTNLHYNAKEFVSSVAKPTKDSTPIVSANSDAAEVILTKKDRESPVKGRKPGQRDPKVEPSKEPQTKEAECDRSSSTVKEDINPVPQTIPLSPPVSNPIPVTEPTPLVIKDVAQENVDKKGVKKPPPTEPKSPEIIENNSPILTEVASSNSGKSKNSQKNKQLSNQNGKPQQLQQQQQQQQQQQLPLPLQQLPQPQPPLSIPVSQPPKANNRSNKTKELNMKGANKEGTDMDAFNDNAPKTEINANILKTNECNIVSPNDIVNANPIPQSAAPPVVPPTIEPEPVINTHHISDTKKIDSNENVTIVNSEHIINNAPVVSTGPPTIVKPINKPFNVTSIIKDIPITILPFPVNDNKDETDKAILQTDKMVLAKNDVNSKVAVENALNDVKSQLPYKPGQWAPDRPEGKKQYERDFLLALKNYPASRQKPDNIPDNVLLDERNRQMDGRVSMGGRTDFTNPPFPNYGGKSGSQRGPPPKRNSQTGKMGSRGGDKSSNKSLPKLSISLRGDVKLHESENAWKPARFNKGETMSDEDKKTESLYRRVRSVLNKLTPQKFDTLVNQVRQLQIDTKERLQGVIDLVFDKAIDEPSFSVAYAKMCKELQIMQVPAGSMLDDKKSVAFRTLLVTRCQIEFEKQSVDETERNVKLKVINECSDQEKKKELSFELQEYDRRLRMKSVGCIRFIGELFKQQMLTASIMRRCLQTLLDNKDEESLECLCKLLTTVGKELESKSVDLSGIFDEMKRIVDGKRQKISSRIRFMLQDVTELRDCKWIPRRGETNPKTMDQIQKEAETEHLNIQVMNMNTPRKDDRGMGPRGGGQRQKASDDGWNSVGSSRNNRQQFSIQTDKMRAAKLPLVDEPLGSSQLFGSWGKGAGGSKNIQQPVTTNTNKYAALENIDMDRRPNSRDSKEPYSSKGPSLERNSYKSSYDGRGSRSGSQHRDTGAPIRSSGPPSVGSVTLPAPVGQPKPSFTPAQPSAPPTVPTPSEEQIERRIHNSLDEYLTGCSTTNEYFEDIATTIPSSDLSKVIYESYNYVLEKSQPARMKTGELFAKLIKTEAVSLESFETGFQELLTLWEDLVIDIPQIWQYFAEDLVHLCLEEVLPINRLHKLLECLIRNNVGQKLLKPLFGLIVKEKGPNFLQNAWQASGMQLSDFMSSSEVQSFTENNFEFLVGGESPVGQIPLSYEEIQRKLSEFFKSKTPFDDIVNWISANIGDRIVDNKFYRTLATAIFEDSISKNKLVADDLTSHSKLIQKYVDNNTSYELQCLYALQSLVHKLEHPQGLLLAICDKLYEDSTFCQESFIAWENSTDPAEQEGKGVALKQLTSFFTQLKENDEDDDYSSNSEDA